MASPFELCDACGRMIVDHEIPVVVRLTVGTLPGTVDLDADELEADGLDPYLVAVFDLTDGIGGASILYGASCFVQGTRTVAAREGETRRLGERSARERRRQELLRRDRRARQMREAREAERARRRDGR